MNRKKDQESLIFLITNHLYKITVISQTMILIMAIALIFGSILYSTIPPEDIPFSGYTAVLWMLFLIVYQFNQIIVPIQNLLIFLLAFQRFLLYFFPNSEKYIIPSEKRFKCFIRWLYFIASFGNVLYIFYLLVCWAARFNHIDLCQNQEKWSTINSAIFIILDVLVMLSSIFYIFILISVLKFKRLAPILMKHNIEKAIAYQSSVLIIVKLFSIPMMFVSFSLIDIDPKYLSWNSIMNMIYYPLFFIDILTTPIVFQITYLFCNKTNLEILLKMNFRKLKTWLIICCGASSNSIDYRLELPNLSSDLTLATT
ncbi:unnamed protein product [Caenorhabditis angaria]|uniref:G-protein coupled receptors family 1 profile domain-containing protein n=1 Tax=Caenorhabditis angaria TaxID=860376 RepID=A0A9P1N5D9_9PELO|nr:unnamed protein product [Caenorhabditis angaria]